MGPKWQAKFVKQLCTVVMNDLIATVKSGRVNSEWDGHEMRELIKDRFASVSGRGLLNGKRKRDYKNHCLVNNLP
jgi:hypothetical protein